MILKTSGRCVYKLCFLPFRKTSNKFWLLLWLFFSNFGAWTFQFTVLDSYLLNPFWFHAFALRGRFPTRRFTPTEADLLRLLLAGTTQTGPHCVKNTSLTYNLLPGWFLWRWLMTWISDPEPSNSAMNSVTSAHRLRFKLGDAYIKNLLTHTDPDVYGFYSRVILHLFFAQNGQESD